MPSIHLSFENSQLRIAQAERVLDLNLEIRWRDADGGEQAWRPFAAEPLLTSVAGLRLEARHTALTLVVEASEEEGFAVLRSRIIPTTRSPFFLRGLRWESVRTEGFAPPAQLVRRSLPYDVWGACSVFPVTRSVPDDQVEYWRTAVFDPSDEAGALTWSVKLPAQWLHRFAIEGECALETIVETNSNRATPSRMTPACSFCPHPGRRWPIFFHS